MSSATAIVVVGLLWAVFLGLLWARTSDMLRRIEVLEERQRRPLRQRYVSNRVVAEDKVPQ